MTVLEFRTRPEWWTRAKCRHVGARKWFAGGSQKMQLSVCAQCTVRELCLESTLAAEDQYGIEWLSGTSGGMKASERMVEIRRRKAASA